MTWLLVAVGALTVLFTLRDIFRTLWHHEKEPDLALAAQVQYVPRLLDAAQQSPAPEVRHAGQMLEHGLHRFTDLLAREFFRGDAAERTDPEHVLPTYAEDHQQG